MTTGLEYLGYPSGRESKLWMTFGYASRTPSNSPAVPTATLKGEQLTDKANYSKINSIELKVLHDPSHRAAMYSVIAACALLILHTVLEEFAQTATPSVLIALFSEPFVLLSNLLKPAVAAVLLCAIVWITLYSCWLLSILSIVAALTLRSPRYPQVLVAFAVDVVIGVMVLQ